MHITEHCVTSKIIYLDNLLWQYNLLSCSEVNYYGIKKVEACWKCPVGNSKTASSTDCSSATTVPRRMRDQGAKWGRARGARGTTAAAGNWSTTTTGTTLHQLRSPKITCRPHMLLLGMPLTTTTTTPHRTGVNCLPHQRVEITTRMMGGFSPPLFQPLQHHHQQQHQIKLPQRC